MSPKDTLTPKDRACVLRMAQTIRAAILGADRAAEDEADRLARRVVERLASSVPPPERGRLSTEEAAAYSGDTPAVRVAGIAASPSSQQSSGSSVMGDVAGRVDMTALASDTIPTTASLRTVTTGVPTASAMLPALPTSPTVTRTGDELLTVGDVARVLAVKRSKAYEVWSRLPKVRLGPRCVRVRREALEDFLRDQERRPRWR